MTITTISFTQYKISQGDVPHRTLWLSVWDFDRFGKNQFLGEVRLPLTKLDLNDSTPHWHTLQDKVSSGARRKGRGLTLSDLSIQAGQEDEESASGELVLALMFKPEGSKGGMGTLSVTVKQAHNLPNLDADAFVKCYLLPDKSAKGKRKTGVIKNNLNPVWEERFTYEKVTLEELSKERVLEVTVWDFNKGSSNDFIGGARLGSAPGMASKHKEWMDSVGDEVSHWEAMLTHPGEWVEEHHTLRRTMDPIDGLLLSFSAPMPGAKDSLYPAVVVEEPEVKDTSAVALQPDAKGSSQSGEIVKVMFRTSTALIKLIIPWLCGFQSTARDQGSGVGSRDQLSTGIMSTTVAIQEPMESEVFQSENPPSPPHQKVSLLLLHIFTHTLH